MNCLLVPTLALDLSLLDRLAASVDYPIRHKVVINNGKPGALHDWKVRHPDWKVLSYHRNIGVAASWNLAPALWPDEDCWLIVNDDVTFQPGCIELICDTARERAKDAPILLLNRTEPMFCFVWTMLGVRQFGLFDENCWVAYYEDNDMRMRFNLAGVKHAFISDPACPVNHGKPKVGGMNYNALVQGCGLFNREYFWRKWGTLDEHHPNFRMPFNAAGLSLAAWSLEVGRRERMLPLWETFMALPNPSIYT